jgi:hypothetical protein
MLLFFHLREASHLIPGKRTHSHNSALAKRMWL